MRASKQVRRLLSMLAGGALASASVLVPVSAAHASVGVTVSASAVNFDNCQAGQPGTCQTRLGHFQLTGQQGEQQLVVTNHGSSTVSIIPTTTSSNGSIDFLLALAAGTSCTKIVNNQVQAEPIAAGASCNLGIAFVPTEFGARSTTMTVNFSDGSSANLALSGTGVGGYYIAGAFAEWATFGFAPEDLESDGVDLNAPVVGVAGDATGNGFWLNASDGGIFTAGDATFLGSLGGIRLNRPVVGLAGTP